jgi:hypothetical protein
MKVSTRYHSTPSGAGRITARGAGGQRTIPYNHASRDPHLDAVHAWANSYLGDTIEITEVLRERQPFAGTRYWEIRIT